MNDFGYGWGDAGNFVNQAAVAASGYGANATNLIGQGNALIAGLIPPPFNLVGVTPVPPAAVYNRPAFAAQTLPIPAFQTLGASLDRASTLTLRQASAPQISLTGFSVEPQTKPDFGFDLPARPSLPILGVLKDAPTVQAPTAILMPDVSGVDVPQPETAPEWTTTVDFDLSGMPGPKPTLPTLAVPTVTVPALPAAPDWNEPAEVVLSEVNLPTMTPITLPDLSGVQVPSLVLPELISRLEFTDEAFDDTLVQELMTQVRAVLGGRLAIPSHIWTRIWERVAADVNRQYLARKREARRAHAKLGWSMPGGVLLEAMQVAATDINAEISAKANEIAIKQAEMQQADYWQAMQQGVACTTLLSQIHNARQERLLKAAIAAVEAQTQVYNAVIAAFNAQVQAISADIETKKLALQGELAKLDVFKAEMEGAKLGVEVDKARVEMYTAQWQAVKTQAEAYESMVRGIAAQVEAQKAAVEAYGEQVKAQSLVVQMWSTEWDAYAKKMESERLKLGKFETEARVFESQIGRYRAVLEGQSQRANIQVEKTKLGLQKAQIDAGRYQADWQGEATKLAGYEAYLKGQQLPLAAGKLQAEVFQSLVQGEIGRSQAQLNEYQALGLLYRRDEIRAQMQNAYASLYGAQVQRERLGVELTQIQADLDKAYAGLVQEHNKTVVGKLQVDAGYNASLVSAQTQMWGVGAELYKADVQGESARTSAEGANYQASVAAAKANADLTAEGARMTLGAWQAASQIATVQLQAGASVYAQLGAAAYAATNASISNSGSFSKSESESVSTNYNYSMQG